MTTLPSPNDARRAGLLYLVPMFVGPFSLLVVPKAIVVANDAAATTANVVASESLFRAGIAGDVVIMLAEIALSAALYTLLAPAGPKLALTATFARLTMTIMQAVNIFPALVALHVARGGASLEAFELGERQAFVLHALEARELGSQVWQCSFALHCALVAVLVYRARYFPRWLGVLMGFAAVGYAASGLGNLVFPPGARIYEGVVTICAIGGEVPFVLWLVVKGCSPEIVGADVGLDDEATRVGGRPRET